MVILNSDLSFAVRMFLTNCLVIFYFICCAEFLWNLMKKELSYGDCIILIKANPN